MGSTDCIVTEYNDSDTIKDSLEDFENFKYGKTQSTDASSETFTDSMTELEKLISILKKGIKKNEPGIKVIKYPNLLVSALEELNQMIGMYRLKESVAIQTVRLIENLKAGEKSPKMLNTVLYGPPGCGKTVSGVMLAKIWFALGFLSPNTTTTTTTKKTFNEIPIGGGGSNSLDPNGFVWFVILIIGSYIVQALSYAYNQIGLFWLAFIVGFVIFVIILIYWSNKDSNWITKYIKEEITEEKLKETSDRDIITVVSRNDLVSGFLGQTSPKTKNLLEANIGKVLFIDEAYSLLNDPRDAYGHECLNTLNLFLSENPDKIIVIFAGYKDQLKNTIFAAQPGLERRILWKFETDPYNGDELADIFLLQAKNDGWYISKEDNIKIKRLISRNESAFPSYGGDTQRLIYLSSLEASRHNLSGISETLLSSNFNSDKKAEKILTFKDVEKGLISLKENNFD
jgi:hypothetical protein